MKKLITILFIAFSLISFSQKEKKTKAQTIENTHSDRLESFKQIKEIHEGGAIVVRLVLHKKNADLYRKAGNFKLANKLEKDLRKRNKEIAFSFLNPHFNFCSVYIIDSKDYGKVLNGETKGYFLNQNLEIDTSIIMTEKNFYFMEIGDVYDAVSLSNSQVKSELSSAPVAQNVLFFTDKHKNQLKKPFPYYTNLYSITIDAQAWINISEGKKYLKTISSRDDISIGDTSVFIKTNKYYSKFTDKSLVKYIENRLEANRFIIKNIKILTDKDEFEKYLNSKYAYKSKGYNIPIKVWELQLRLYGMYSQSLELNYGKILKKYHFFDHPFLNDEFFKYYEEVKL